MAEMLMMPTLGLTMTEGTVDQWYKKVGDKVSKGEPVVAISSEKLTHDVEAPCDGILLAISVEDGGEAPCKAAIGYVGAEGEEVPKSDGVTETTSEKVKTESQVEPSATNTEVQIQSVERQEGARIFATPLARKLAAEKGYELQDVVGTGGNGRITRLDVNRHVPSPAVVNSGIVGTIGEGLNGMRKVIAQRMHHSLHHTAQLTLQRKADITELMTFRKELKVKAGDSLNRQALSINTLLIKAVSLALQDYPEMNAWYDGQQHTLVEGVSVGVAVAVDDGLVVPVIQNVHQKSLTQIGSDFSEVTSQAIDGTLAGDKYTGSTFTITNLGSLGIEYFTPILNTPEVGILGIGATSRRLDIDEEQQLVIHQELPLSLTFDHQVIDGSPAAEFLQRVVYYLENPYALIV
ncbi:branched-chain alpha-keto acid dehydrogenase subunit E2 [Vagococcus penaei]|uniref:Dihydrolipoamide acetyltransferase component of pyruvate dehydrogenase complex n=1 Tax=Vagococcus penaei TaxID=633807 RepID=A0A1Q2D564_9ENTE|nr:dihydrolipoamide acetyltransferase family protein [Vagococcus penaei]AQP53347.1 branched-chain alpha-keto acid dehydrogenase subunit E2 [Vagococcus penaei]RSU04118.1 branched-chain alpha-keto acid dehydrogenase subunit E2 [Vagococcus penaei]